MIPILRGLPWVLALSVLPPVLTDTTMAGAGSPTAAATESVVFAAGDIAKCEDDDTWLDELKELVGLKTPDRPGSTRSELFLEMLGLKQEANGPSDAEVTARLLAPLEGTVLALGDLAYTAGTSVEYVECFERYWGALKPRIRPVPGNHEYRSRNAAPYFAYWGAQAGEAGRGYYSFDLPGWHLIALNSNIDNEPGTAQYAWLQADLAATEAPCLLAFWHHPVYSSGRHGGRAEMGAVWRLLYERGASLVLSGHDHDYERFAPLNAQGAPDPERGLRQFVVGTGGAELRKVRRATHAQSRRFTADHLGVLRLELREGAYSWSFLSDGAFHDSGSAACTARLATEARAPTRPPIGQWR